MESILHASNMLGVTASLVQPAPGRKARRSRKTGATTTTQGISSIDRPDSRQLTVGGQGISGSCTQEAIVEAMTDAALVELVLTGDQEAFSVLVERYKDAIQNPSSRMLSNTPEAEDVTQEAFVRAYTQLAPYTPAHTFS